MGKRQRPEPHKRQGRGKKKRRQQRRPKRPKKWRRRRRERMSTTVKPTARKTREKKTCLLNHVQGNRSWNLAPKTKTAKGPRMRKARQNLNRLLVRLRRNGQRKKSSLRIRVRDLRTRTKTRRLARQKGEKILPKLATERRRRKRRRR